MAPRRARRAAKSVLAGHTHRKTCWGTCSAATLPTLARSLRTSGTTHADQAHMPGGTGGRGSLVHVGTGAGFGKHEHSGGVVLPAAFAHPLLRYQSAAGHDGGGGERQQPHMLLAHFLCPQGRRRREGCCLRLGARAHPPLPNFSAGLGAKALQPQPHTVATAQPQQEAPSSGSQAIPPRYGTSQPASAAFVPPGPPTQTQTLEPKPHRAKRFALHTRGEEDSSRTRHSHSDRRGSAKRSAAQHASSPRTAALR